MTSAVKQSTKSHPTVEISDAAKAIPSTSGIKSNAKKSRSSNICSICNKSYYDKSATQCGWIQCLTCSKWQHEDCANMNNKNLYGYECVECNMDDD